MAAYFDIRWCEFLKRDIPVPIYIRTLVKTENNHHIVPERQYVVFRLLNVSMQLYSHINCGVYNLINTVCLMKS